MSYVEVNYIHEIMEQTGQLRMEALLELFRKIRRSNRFLADTRFMTQAYFLNTDVKILFPVYGKGTKS